MGTKRGLTLELIIAAAAEIADRDGLAALSLASLASNLGVRSPSLYNHVDGQAALRRELGMHAASILATDLVDAIGGRDGAAALRAAALALRDYAHRHPGLYASLLPAPTPDQDPVLAAALLVPVTVVGSVLVEMGVDSEIVISLIRVFRAAVHGFVDLELRGGFGLPDDIDDSFALLVELVIQACSS